MCIVRHDTFIATVVKCLVEKKSVVVSKKAVRCCVRKNDGGQRKTDTSKCCGACW